MTDTAATKHDPAPEPAPSFHCGLCGAGARTPVVTGRDRQHGIAGTWTLSRCGACGLVQMDPMPDGARVGDFYPAVYYAHRASKSTFRTVRVSSVKRYVLRHVYGHPPGRGNAMHRLFASGLSLFVSRKNLLDWVGAGRLLDVGCGVGSAIWRLRAYGWDVQGVETDAEAAAVGTAQGLTIHVGDLASAALPGESFDLVRLSHVLEHTTDPVGLLREVRRVLRPGGRLWMALPNIESRNFVRYGAEWFPLELPRHLYHFSIRTLKACCAEAGFEVVGVRFRSSPELVARTMQYRREDRARGDGRVLRGRPLEQRRWFKRLLLPWTRWLDARGAGDLMEITCATRDEPRS